MKTKKEKGTASKIKDSSAFYIVLGLAMALLINNGLAFALSTDMPIVAVESGSMEPTFYRGDILVLQGVPADQLKVGDIIVFSPAEKATPVVHRIIKINDDGSFQTKGDANPGQIPFEKHIEASQIHGKVILIIPYLGWVKLFMMEYILPHMFLVILGIAVIGGLYIAGPKIRSFIK